MFPEKTVHSQFHHITLSGTNVGSPLISPMADPCPVVTLQLCPSLMTHPFTEPSSEFWSLSGEQTLNSELARRPSHLLIPWARTFLPTQVGELHKGRATWLVRAFSTLPRGHWATSSHSG